MSVWALNQLPHQANGMLLIAAFLLCLWLVSMKANGFDDFRLGYNRHDDWAIDLDSVGIDNHRHNSTTPNAKSLHRFTF